MGWMLGRCWTPFGNGLHIAPAKAKQRVVKVKVFQVNFGLGITRKIWSTQLPISFSFEYHHHLSAASFSHSGAKAGILLGKDKEQRLSEGLPKSYP